MKKPNYVIERWPLGWVICAADGRQGIPLDALNEAMPLMPDKAIIDAGIAHHLRHRHVRRAVLCVTLAADAEAWRKEIDEELKDAGPQARWWHGTDVGKSSAAIFAVFCDGQWMHESNEMGEGSTPADADDFGRCKRLLDTFPEWRGSLHKVAEAYPDTAWPKIMARWSEIENATPQRQTEILQSL